MKMKLTVTADFTEEFNETIRRFKRDAVFIGIPEVKTERRDKGDEEKPEQIGNAAILAINEFGSPANNIPPRQPMQTGICKAQNEIAEEFKRGAVKALSDGPDALPIAYSRAGIIASNSVKKVINEQENMKPPSDATITAREAHGFKGEKALIVTGQMRNAITYVVKGKGE